MNRQHSATSTYADKLLFGGTLLLFLGLVTGVAVPFLANPRMALSSHIEGVLNGMLLLILGLVWPKLSLSVAWQRAAFWLALYGTYANWIGILIAALFNAGGMLTIAAQGREGHPAAEGIVAFSLLSLTAAMIIVSLIVLVGLYRNMSKEKMSE